MASCFAALETISKAAGTAVLNAFDNPNWTSAQFATVVRELKQHKAVKRHALQAKLGVNGGAVVAAMLRANLLSLRPGWSKFAQDIPLETWAGKKDDELITAASAMYLYKMRSLPEEVSSPQCMWR